MNTIQVIEALAAGLAVGAATYGATHNLEASVIAGIGSFAAKLSPKQVVGGASPSSTP